MLKGQPPTIYGDGHQSRDFTFIDNVVRANLLACIAPDAAGGLFNNACGERYTLLEPVAAGRLRATADFSVLAECDYRTGTRHKG